METNRWLVGYDFSTHADAALELVADDLELLGGELHLLHVYAVPSVPLSYEWSGADAVYATSRDLDAALRADVLRSLERVADAARKRHPTVEIFTHVRAGQPASAILSEARELSVDRIAVGSAGRKGVSHLLLGSVAERVVRLAELPVLVVKAPERERARRTKESE